MTKALTVTIALLLACLAASAQARLIADNDALFVDYALGHGHHYSVQKFTVVLERIAKVISKIAKGLEYVAEALNLLKERFANDNGTLYVSGDANLRQFLLETSEKLAHPPSSTQEEELTSKIVAALFEEAAFRTDLNNDSLEEYLQERFAEVVVRLEETGDVLHVTGKDEPVDLTAAKAVIARIVNSK